MTFLTTPPGLDSCDVRDREGYAVRMVPCSQRAGHRALHSGNQEVHRHEERVGVRLSRALHKNVLSTVIPGPASAIRPACRIRSPGTVPVSVACSASTVVVFATKLFDPVLLTNAGFAFASFCLLAGAVYTINDLADVEADRVHPVKRTRPIASGRVPEGVARVFSIILVIVSLVGGYLISPLFAAVAGGYFALNVAYTMKLKHVAYLDVACISAGFVLRVLGGGYATRIEVSWYLFVCTALLALFLGFGKRRHELTTASAKAGKQRTALRGYSKRGLDVALTITSLLTVGTYLTYTLDEETLAFFRADVLWPTTLFVILGVLRFLHIVRYRPQGGEPYSGDAFGRSHGRHCAPVDRRDRLSSLPSPAHLGREGLRQDGRVPSRSDDFVVFRRVTEISGPVL